MPKAQNLSGTLHPNEIPRWTYLLGLLVLTCIFYFPGLQNGFVNWDDAVYVTDNQYIHQLTADNLKHIFTNEVAENYHPVTFVSLALDYAIAGTDPFVYHLVNLLLHLACTLLVFRFISRLSGHSRPVAAFLVALLFALHPMHVESVAWVTGRKDLLFTLFFLGGLLAYQSYLDKRQFKWLGLCFGFSVLSLLSKPAAVSFFLVLPLLDYWHGRKISLRALLEKIPFAAAALAIAVITIAIQADSSLKTLEEISLLDRFNFASYGVVAYLVKTILPLNLNPFHAYPDLSNVPIWYYYMPFVALVMVGGIAWFSWKRGWKAGLFGLGFFLITLGPTMQLVSFGEAIISERYTYLPYVGLFFIMADALARWAKRTRFRDLVLVGTTAFCAILAVVTFRQVQIWKDGISLWTTAIEGGQYPTSRAYTNRGTAYAYAGKYELAVEDFNQAKLLNEREFDAYHNTGIIYYRQNRLEEALQQLNQALEIIPLHPNALGNRGHVYFKQNEFDNAIRDYTASINGDPYRSEIYNMRGFILYAHKQRYTQAIEDFNTAIRLSQNYAAPYVNRSKAYLAAGDPVKAKEDIETAARLGFEIDPAYRQEVAVKLASQ